MGNLIVTRVFLYVQSVVRSKRSYYYAVLLDIVVSNLLSRGTIEYTTRLSCGQIEKRGSLFVRPISGFLDEYDLCVLKKLQKIPKMRKNDDIL